MIIEGKVGVQQLGDGAENEIRIGRQGDALVSQLHGRFYEQALRGNLFSAGSGLTALSANTVTLTATTTPIVGVYNPLTSKVNLVMLQAGLAVIANSNAATAPGAFVWAAMTNQAAISTGAAPFNRGTLGRTGSAALAFNGGVALTGLANNLVVIEGADFPGMHTIAYSAVAATAFYNGVQAVQHFDGSLIVPPGGVLALLNTVSTTTFSVWSRLLWEEVPI